MTTVTNGVNVQALLEAREVLKGAPEAAQFTWRASSKWQTGVHSEIKVENFFGLGEEHSHLQESVFQADHPEVFAATDNGITPIIGASSSARSSRWSRARMTFAASSAPTATSATASTTSR
jgi:hypothetical protein